jgi:hypothetical protein
MTALQKLEAFKKKQQEEKETGEIRERSVEDDMMVLRSLMSSKKSKSPQKKQSQSMVSKDELSKLQDKLMKRFDDMDKVMSAIRNEL